MTNIPTELLRALIAVVDQRSFTKAAAALGITQPAVSAQIKRLRFLLGDDVFDRSSHGIRLTPQGERVASYARRLLSINDQIVHIGGDGPRPELVIRVGTPSDFIASMLPSTLGAIPRALAGRALHRAHRLLRSAGARPARRRSRSWSSA